MAKKDNTGLIVMAAAGGGLLYFSAKKQEPKIGGQTIASIFKKYGMVDGLEYIIQRIEAWNESPSLPGYNKLQEIAVLVYEKAVDLSNASTVLFKKLMDNADSGMLSAIAYVTGQSITLNNLKSIYKDIYDKQISKQAEVINYIKASPGVGVSRYKDVIIDLLTIAKANHAAIAKYKASWGSSILGAFSAVTSTLDSLWQAVSGMGRLAIMALKYAPYLILGIGGVWAYNNLLKQGTG